VINYRDPICRRFAWVGIAAALLIAAPLASAQDEGGSKQHFELSEKVSDGLQKLKPLSETKNFTGMLDLVNGLLAQVKPDSYDTAYLLDMKAKVYLQLDQYNNAIDPWEECLRLSEEKGYKDEKERLDITKYLAQLIYSEATAIKDHVQQQQLIAKSASYLKRYLAKATKQEPETQILYASILYAQATADEKHINQDMLREARQTIERGMLGSIRPKDSFYMLLLAILQQQNDYANSAKIMELLLKQYPNKKDVWPMLFGTYVNLAGGQKENSREQRELFVRAINTIERAQQLGYMNSPRDNYNRFTLYLNAGELHMATDILYDGLKKGTIESTVGNWKILGAYLQQANKELQAISTLKEATKLFPKEGSLEFMIGQIYQQLDKIKDARDAYTRAVAKGNLGDKPHQAWLFLAYTSLELEDYDNALKAITEAAKFPAGAKDPQVKNLKDGIDSMIQEREAAKAASKKL
jgi:tetratricopeptide (TPR) repeat protein